jgi:hypothetical protein
MRARFWRSADRRTLNGMNGQQESTVPRGELESLFEEIVHYLEAVDVFRREGCEPSWRRERIQKEVSR